MNKVNRIYMGLTHVQYVLQYIPIPRVGTKSRPAKPSLLRGKSAWGRIRHLEAPKMKLTDYGWTRDVTLFVTLFCLCLKNQGWVCGCLEDPYCASPKKQGWKTRRELVESWCGCCEPVGNRNGWNCISHKLAVTRFTASLQYQVSFCFSSPLASSKCVCTSLILTISLLPFLLNSYNLVKSRLIIFHSMSSFTFLKATNKPRIRTFPNFVMSVIALC